MRILITGASRGIGRDAVLALAEDPNHRILALSRNTQGLMELQEEAMQRHGSGQRVQILPFDLEQPDWHTLQAALGVLGGVDVLINNAGLLISRPFAELSDADWDALFAVNFFGAVRLIRTVLPQLQQGNRPHIVNISSMGGYQGSSKFPGLSAYSASKAALANLTECLAEELKDSGIAVNCLALGAVGTEMLTAAFPGYQAPVTSSEMGEFLAYFATRGHHFFNGKILPVSVTTP
ncbi:MAG: SDR family oxidoreductase [Lewinellaceae bacterium]|nr:SDR family oxidoreductase [Lewinellaceae bacterium]